jgi:hypothetical protein
MVPAAFLLRHIQPAMRKSAPRGLDVVAADGDVEPAVPVHVAEARLAVVGVLVAHAHLLRHFTKHVPRRHPHDLDHVVLGIARHAHVGTLHRCWVTRLRQLFANRCRVVEPEREPPEAVLREHPFHRIAGCRRRFFAGNFTQPQITARPLQQCPAGGGRFHFAHPDAVAVELCARLDIAGAKLEHRVHDFQFVAIRPRGWSGRRCVRRRPPCPPPCEERPGVVQRDRPVAVRVHLREQGTGEFLCADFPVAVAIELPKPIGKVALS